ncbi:signal peptidase complex subunit 2-like [Oscarella lobularis]|uniref:signal peptidase complex subunit 2-like n=1 Tax=Oscarella lobularis TaxID=121494 RepID=UPI0033143A49
MSKKDSSFKWSLNEKPIKVDKWDGAKVKNALDDAAKKILTDMGCKESHSLMDIRLAICSLACVLSLFALAYDYLFPFPLSKYILAFCSLGYFFLMSILTLFTAFKERNYVYWGVQNPAGKDSSPRFWALRSILKRFDHEFTLVMEMQRGKGGQTFESEFTKSIGTWFDDEGILHEDEFKKSVKELHADLLSRGKDD